MRLLLSLCLLLLPIFSILPERTCTGKDCQSLERKYGGFIDNFERNYIPELTKDMFKAQATTHLTAIPYHTMLGKFAFGWYGTVAVTQQQKIAIFDPPTNQYKKMNEFGFAFGNNFYAGVNVGWMFSFLYNFYLNNFSCNMYSFTECNFTYQFPILSRVEIYANGSGKFERNIEYNFQDTYYGNRKGMSNFGYMLRIQLFKERTLLGIVTMPGLSAGASYQRSRVDFAKKINDIDLGFKVNELKYEWEGDNVINYRSDIESNIFDARTGIKLFDTLVLYFSVGFSYSRGGSFVSLYRNGTYMVANEPTTLTIHMKSNYYNNNYVQKFYTVGVNIGGFTVQGTSTFGQNSIDARKNYALTVGFTVVIH